MKLLLSTLALALPGGAALLQAVPAQPSDPPLAVAPAQAAPPPPPQPSLPNSRGRAPLQEPDVAGQQAEEQVRRELERARRELQRALEEAERERADLERQLAREMQRVQEEVRRVQAEAEREAQRAQQDAQRARQEGEREARRAQHEAQQVAEQARREAQEAREQAMREARRAMQEAEREVLRAREEAQREARQAREEVLREARPPVARGVSGRTAPSSASSERERRLEERIAVLERQLAARSERAPARVFGLGIAPAAPAPAARPAAPAVPAPPAPAAAPAGHGCCCCCCSHHHGGHGECSHHEGVQSGGEVGFLLIAPGGEVVDLADVTSGAQGPWLDAWTTEPGDDVDRQLAELEAQLPATGHVFLGDLALEPDSVDALLEVVGEEGACGGEGQGACCEDEGAAPGEADLFFQAPDSRAPERIPPSTLGLTPGVPSVVRSGGWTAAPRAADTLFLPATARWEEPVGGELAELVEEMRAEVRSLREVLQALREDLRDGALDGQL